MMMGIALIDNKQVKVQIIDNNYNEHAAEIEILEGTWKGQRVIVEHKDLSITTPKTYKQLINIVKNNIGNEDLEDHHFGEFIDNITYDIIQSFASNYELTDKDYYDLLLNSSYDSCKDKNQVKTYIMMDALQESLQNEKSSFTKIKNKALKEVRE